MASFGFDSSEIALVSGRVNEGTNSFAVARISPWREVPLYETPVGFPVFGLVGAVMGWVPFEENPGGRLRRVPAAPEEEEADDDGRARPADRPLAEARRAQAAAAQHSADAGRRRTTVPLDVRRNDCMDP